MNGDNAAFVSEARVSTSSIISAHQSPALLTWFACVYPVADVTNQPPELKGADIVFTIFRCLTSCAVIINVLEDILDELRKRCSR